MHGVDERQTGEGSLDDRTEKTGEPHDWTVLIRRPGLPTRARTLVRLIGFFAFTIPLMPVQAALVKTWPHGARRLPHWYHRQVCRLLGVRVTVEGRLAEGRPVLVLANHASWLDIPVISAAAPVSFVAKKEVASWPFVSWLAKLQRTVFVDRTRRTSVGDTAGEMIERLAAGDAIVLFPEGTSSDNNRVLPFKTSLLAAAKPTRGATRANGDATGADPSEPAMPGHDVVIQTLALVYTRQHGLPIGRAHRHLVGWFGDMSLPDHVLRLLEACPIDVVVRLSEPVPLDDFADRKALARFSEDAVRSHVVDLLRTAPPIR